ncbi:N-acetyltransferase [Natronosporangium hydrolyticum]|uniref:N-acetyltransferase n=1 Tax=Natronosporangium hydrolyticum TaxID=2811111 RepID=A0A895YIL6_9ACTN|nr:N-acetyltransferase [Natronosporangium hydrolyticum]QSB13960.1 N-acetyltransferase [Natronosporangium hydrolyticum]
MRIRRETADDVAAIRAVHAAAFHHDDGPAVPVEVGLVDALRADDGWLPALSLVAVTDGGEVAGHVVCTRGRVGDSPALGLGPIGVLPGQQRRGVGSALMWSVLGAAEALGESLVVLLGHTDYYPRFGFRSAAELGIAAPVADWEGPYFQALALSAYRPEILGEFRYAEPFHLL